MDKSKLPPKLRKKLAIAELAVKAACIAKHMATPEFEEAMKEREEYISRGYLWITPLSIKYAPLAMQLASIQAQMQSIRNARI